MSVVISNTSVYYEGGEGMWSGLQPIHRRVREGDSGSSDRSFSMGTTQKKHNTTHLTHYRLGKGWWGCPVNTRAAISRGRGSREVLVGVPTTV